VTVTSKATVWKAVSYGTGALATLGTRKLLTAAWSARRSDPPPDGPGTLRATLPEALTWAVAVGAGIGVARIVAIRSAARVWEAATHEAPPVPDA